MLWSFISVTALARVFFCAMSLRIYRSFLIGQLTVADWSPHHHSCYHSGLACLCCHTVDLSDSFLCCEDDPEKAEPSVEKTEKCVSDSLLPATPDLIFEVNKADFVLAEQNDPTLAKCLLAANSSNQNPWVYSIENDMLMRKWHPPSFNWNVFQQIVVPQKFRPQVLGFAHDSFSGHLWIRKIYCHSCHICQVSGKPNQVIPPASLHSIPALGEPFQHILIDCVGPLPKKKLGHQYILTLMCAPTRFPEAILLRTLKVKAVVRALVNFFYTFGLPNSVQTEGQILCPKYLLRSWNFLA